MEEGADGIRVKDGRKLELPGLRFPSAEVHKPLPEVIKSQLFEVGIDIKIVEVGDTGIYGEELKQGKGDLWLEADHKITLTLFSFRNCSFTLKAYIACYIRSICRWLKI